MLDFIFRKPTKIENDFFGTMLFLEFRKEPNKSYFECKRHFKPSDKIIEICIDGDPSGPTQIQIDFFKSMESNYADIIKSITPQIESEFKKWNEGFKVLNFLKEFDPVYLKIPRCVDKTIIWEIAFVPAQDANQYVTLTMSNFEPEEILIDG